MDKVNEILNTLRNVISIVGVADILDMVIVTFLVYKLITFFSRTNSMNVVYGIFFLLGVMWLTTIIDLPVVSFLLGGAFEMGLIVVIVLFQPEIRRILERIGGSVKDLFGHPVKMKSLENAIDQTVLAFADMSKSRTGALMVFERGKNLEPYIKTGTLVDASITAELLKNIFYDKAPLHDGAVIVRNGRIESAACMLPLSESSSISRELGMRHRAGIGMSERSDAVVAIVSEETGDISVAIEGQHIKGLTPETFEKKLRMELLPQENEERGFFGRIKAFFQKKKEDE